MQTTCKTTSLYSPSRFHILVNFILLRFKPSMTGISIVSLTMYQNRNTSARKKKSYFFYIKNGVIWRILNPLRKKFIVKEQTKRQTNSNATKCDIRISVPNFGGLVSHICIMKNNSQFPSDAYMHHKSIYSSYNPRGRPRKVSGRPRQANFEHRKGYCQVRTQNGGGTRQISVCKETKMGGIIEA